MTTAEAANPTAASTTSQHVKLHHAPLTTSSPTHVRKWLEKNHPKQLLLLEKFETELRRDQINFTKDDGSGTVNRIAATAKTVEFLRSMIGSTRWKTGGQLLMLLKGLGRELNNAGGHREPAIENMVRRIMCAVRDEVTAGTTIQTDTAYATTTMKEEEDDTFDDAKIASFSAKIPSGGVERLSLTSMLWAHPQHVQVRSRIASSSVMTKRSDSFSSVTSEPTSSAAPWSQQVLHTGSEYDALPPPFHDIRPDLKPSIMEVIQEVLSDLEDLHNNINDQAINHVHSGEVILTYGRSQTIQMFLTAAANKDRHFLLIVCESAPSFGGHYMAQSFSKTLPNVKTVVVHDAAAFAVMSRVNKVILPAHAVLANGGLVTHSGAHAVALAAKHHSVPVLIVTGMFKLCPMYPHEGQDTLQDFIAPSSVLPYSERYPREMVELVNPVHDYIPPHLIHLYVTNIGCFQPSYIYRLLSEYYHNDDWESFQE